MSSYYQYHQHQPTAANAQAPSHHHGGRSRRAPRVSTSQNAHSKQFRGVRSMRELTDAAVVSAYRQKFEAARSFDLDDDMEFCPNLLTEDDLVSINSASSDRSSLSSGSPESSPTQQPQQVTSTFSLNSASNPYIPVYQSQSNQSTQPSSQLPVQLSSQPSNHKLHQPAATRTGKAIPIVNPQTGISMSSPPPSVSPARMHQGLGRRGW